MKHVFDIDCFEVRCSFVIGGIDCVLCCLSGGGDYVEACCLVKGAEFELAGKVTLVARLHSFVWSFGIGIDLGWHYSHHSSYFSPSISYMPSSSSL